MVTFNSATWNISISDEYGYTVYTSQECVLFYYTAMTVVTIVHDSLGSVCAILVHIR